MRCPTPIARSSIICLSVGLAVTSCRDQAPEPPHEGPAAGEQAPPPLTATPSPEPVTTPATLPEEVAPAAPAEAPVVYAEVPTVPEVPVEARSVDKALEAAAPDREVTVYAWLYRNKEPCPTCPPDVKCAPCPPPYDLFAGRPLEEVRELGSAGPLLMVDFPTDRGRLSPHEVYVITGRFQQAPGGWVLKATRIARSAHAPGFDPQQPGLEP